MRADAFAQHTLLDVQELDRRIDQLRHRLGSLPETQRLAALATERVEVDGQTRDARIEVDDLAREQRKADADVEQVKARRTRDQDRMDRGLVTSPKDLARMQDELVSLARRISDLEDTELEVMERLEAAQAEHTRLTARLEELDAEIAEVTARRDELAGDIARDGSAATEERARTASGVPEDLLALYERIRAQKGGTGAAALLRRRCSGCQMDITAADLGVVSKAPLDEVLRCPECDRILVRTAESGLR